MSDHNLLISPEQQDVALLKSLAWLQTLPPLILARLAVFAKHVSFPSGQIIVREGEGASWVVRCRWCVWGSDPCWHLCLSLAFSGLSQC